MSTITNFPTLFASFFVSTWLELTDIVKLDSAHCNLYGRVAFLSIAYVGDRFPATINLYISTGKLCLNELFAAHWPKIVEWISMKGIKVDGLFLSKNEFSPSLYKKALICCKPTTTWLYLFVPTDGGLLCMEPIREALSACPNLSRLHIQSNGGEEQSLLKAVVFHCPHIKQLKLSGFRLATSGGLAHIGPEVVELDLSGCRLNLGVTLSALQATGLQVLRLPRGSNNSSALMQKIALSGSTLHTFESCSEINDVAMQVLAQNCSALHTLLLSAICNLEDETINLLATNTAEKLRHFRVQRCNHLRIADSLVTAMAKHCRHLRTLHIANISKRGLSAITSCCQKLRDVTLQDCNGFTATMMQDLGRLPHLRSFAAIECSDLTDSCMSALVSRAPLLEKIRLSNCKELTDAAIVAVGQQCAHLRRVDFYCLEKITDKGLSVLLQNNRHVQHVSVTHCASVTDAFLLTLADCCPSIVKIDITGCTLVSNGAAFVVAQSYPRLRQFVTTGCPLIDRDMRDEILRICPRLPRARKAR